MIAKDITGQRFGSLVAIKPTDKRKHGYIVWVCKCDCGKEVEVCSSHLTNGYIKSCGCSRIKHGQSYKRLYHIWQSMKQRCYNPNMKRYEDYGGRGIKVCDEWNDFINFYNWAINNGYAYNLSIDRINLDGDYEPQNCRWSTPKEQDNNRRNNVFITFNGKTQTIAQWSEETGIKYETLRSRIRRGLSIEQIFNKR